MRAFTNQELAQANFQPNTFGALVKRSGNNFIVKLRLSGGELEDSQLVSELERIRDRLPSMPQGVTFIEEA